MRNARTIYAEPVPGFQGLRPDLPVTVYRRHLPHWRQDGATYFVTFRLADALPHAAVEALREEREAWLAAHVGRDSNPDSQSTSGLLSRPTADSALWLEYERLAFRSLERWLDAGHGSLALLRPEARASLVEQFAYFDGERYSLGCYVIMPNHVHAVVRPLNVTPPNGSDVGRDRNPDSVSGSRDCDPDLQDIVGSWKRRSARSVGVGWQDETYDRIVRDVEELYRTVNYIEDNPLKAGSDGVFWISDAWKNVGRDRNPDQVRESRDCYPDLQ